MTTSKYQPECLKCGFRFIEDKRGQKPQRVICTEEHETIKLTRHLQTKHPAWRDQPVVKYTCLTDLHKDRSGESILFCSLIYYVQF